MSSLLKLLPVAVIGYVAWFNTGSLRKAFDVVGQVQTTLASVEINNIARAIRMDYEDSRRLPLDNFSEFLELNMVEAGGKKTRNRSRDSWGTPYRLQQTAKGFAIQSAGPDRAWGTADDISREFTLE